MLGTADEKYFDFFGDEYISGGINNLSSESLTINSTNCDTLFNVGIRPDGTSSSTEHNSAIAIQKRRIRRKTFIPRLVKCDIRSLFSSMYTNMFNIMDYNMIKGFFNEFSAADMSLEYVVDDPLIEYLAGMIPNLSRKAVITTASSAAHFLFASSLATPDATIKLINPHVIQKLDSAESQIVAGFELYTTRVHDSMIYWEVVGSVEEAAPKSWDSCTKASDVSFSVESESVSGTKGVIKGYSIEHTRALLDRSPLLPEPISVCETGTVKVCFDTNRKITRIVMTSTHMGELSDSIEKSAALMNELR